MAAVPDPPSCTTQSSTRQSVDASIPTLLPPPIRSTRQLLAMEELPRTMPVVKVDPETLQRTIVNLVPPTNSANEVPRSLRSSTRHSVAFDRFKPLTPQPSTTPLRTAM